MKFSMLDEFINLANSEAGGGGKVKFVSEGGDPCPECSAYNGNVFTKGTEPQLPLHPNCRCSYVKA